MHPFLFLLLGVVVVSAVAYAQYAFGAGKGTRGVLVPGKFLRFKLKDRIKVSHDSYVFRFALPRETDTLGLPIGQHITLRALCDVKKEVDDGEGNKVIHQSQEMVSHTYTPITSDNEKGYVDFMIKVYFAKTNPLFPFGGRLSQHLYKMKVGDEMEMMGPKGHFTYHLEGNFSLQNPRTGLVQRHVSAFAMIAGGTGITPLLQIMRAIHTHGNDATKVYLLYSNKTEDDILLRKELDELVQERPDQFHVYYTLTQKAPAKWPYSTGRVDESMLRKHLPNPQDFAGGDVQALLCGPAAMLTQAVKPNLLRIGYTVDSIFTF